MTRASLAVIAVTMIASASAAADPAPPSPSLPPEAEACAAALRGARDRVARVNRAFRGARVDGLGPVVRAPTRGGPRVKPTPGFVRHGWGASVDLQRMAVPEYFYVDVVDLRDDRGGWAAIAGDDAWACTVRDSGDQHNVDCVRRRGDHVAIVRAIHWHRVSPRHVEAYLAAFREAGEACLAQAAPP